MKIDLLLKGVLSAIFLASTLFPVVAQDKEQVDAEEPNAKAARYHSLLLKKPGNTMVFSRFVDAWLDTGSKDGLTGWLESEAKGGAAADWRVLGALHQYLGEDEEALKAMNEAVNRDAENAELRLSRAKMQARLLAFEAALIDLEVASKDEKTAIEASKLKGVYLARSGQVEEAVKAWKEVIATYPNDEDLREDLIEVEVMEGLYQDAIEASRALVGMTKDPYKKTLRRLRLGDIQILSGDRDGGLKSYEEIMAATGEGTWLEREVLAQVERVFLKEDDIKGLRDYYQKLREEYPRRVSIRKVLARQMALNDEIKEAIALFEEVLKITPGDLGNREEFIAFLEANEKWQEAKDELGGLLEQRKDDALLWERYARIEAKLNNQEGLKAALAKVAELRKVSPEGLLATAALYEQAKLGTEAEALLREGREGFPDSLEVAEGLASYLIQNQKEEEALEIWKAMAKGADREGLLRVARSLSSHGKSEVAFGLLEERIGDFGNDSLILTQFCKLANSVEEAGKAIPQGLALVNKAATPTELETAVQIAMRLVARAEKKEEIKKSLAGQADLGIGGQCLLSAIYADLGDTLAASSILAKAGESPDGSLARFYRVRFEENQGDFEKAIEILRGIIETPEGRKTVHFRRLVNLLERAGEFEKALVAVEDWKRMAPGDHSAWMRRARLLQTNFRPEDAVVELRRMIGKFGADEERRATLATALIEAAEFTPAQRIYEQLYSESERLESKLKWAGEMAQLAEREGKLEELLEDFDRRKRTNPRSVAPLLAIAEIHRVLDQYEERRSALLEASRRRPDDTQLLARIAEVEERAGEFDRAVGILRDAVKRDKTPESKRRLAALLLKNGEIQSGLDLLAEIPGTVDDPRGLEGVVKALMSANETEQALDFLDKHLAKHATDWRLQFLKGMVLKAEGQSEKALAVFVSLLKSENKIPNLKPLVSKNNSGIFMGPWSALFGANGWQELTPFQQYLSRSRFNMPGQTRNINIALPGTPREAQLMGLLEGSGLLTEIPEKNLAEAQKALSLPGIKDADIFVSMMGGGMGDSMAILEKRLEEEPDNPGLFALSLVSKGNTGGITEEEFIKAERILLKDNPSAFALIAFSALRSPEVTAERIAKALAGSLESLPEDNANELMEVMSFFTFQNFGMRGQGEKDMSPLKELMAEQALKAVEAPKSWQWMLSVVSYLLQEKRVADAITLINRHCEWMALSKNPNQATGITRILFSASSQGNAYLTRPAFPPTSLKGVPDTFLTLFPVKVSKEAGNDERARLLAQLQLQDDSGNTMSPSEELKGRVGEIKSPALRALAFLSFEQSEEAKQLIEKMLESKEESSLLFAAGYFFDQDDPRSYDALLKLRMLPLSRESRKKVDGHLAMVGSYFSKKEGVKVDLEPAKRAALRLRRVLTTGERDSLAAVLVNLGLEKEAKRLAAAPKPAVTRGRTGGMIPGRGQQNRIQELKKEGNIDGASREAAKQFRVLVAGDNNEYEMRNLAQLLSTKELKEETLKKLDPGESESTKRLLEFASAQEYLGTQEKAREVYEKVLKKNPNLIQAKVGFIKNTPFNEIDRDNLIIKKAGKVDSEASGIIFDSLWKDANSAETLDRFVQLSQLTTDFLEALTPSGDGKRNLSWVPYYILNFASNNYLGDDQLDILIQTDNSFGGYRGDLDKDATKKRNDAVQAVFLAMIKHPQIAEQGFMLLEASQKGLALSDDDLAKHARSALLRSLEKEEDGRNYGRGLWSKYSGNSSSSSGELSDPKGPMNWLMAHAVKTKTEMFTPELTEKMKKAQPEKFALLNQARALAQAESAEAQKIYEAWKEKLPVGKRKKAISFARQILLFRPKRGPWADDLEKLLLESDSSQRGYYGYGSNDGGWSQLCADWGAWRLRTGGVQEYEAFLLGLFERSYGPSDKWGVLAELGEDALPSKYQQVGYSFRQVSARLLNSPKLVKPTLLFIAQHPLEEFVYDLDDGVRNAWTPDYSSPDRAIKRIVENQLLTPEEGSETATSRQVIMVAEAMLKINLNGGAEVKKKLGEAISKEKGLDPLLQKIAAASILGYPVGRRMIEPVMEENLEIFAEVVKTSPERSYKVFRRWFPKMEKSQVSAPLKELFEGFAVEARRKKLAKMTSWVKDGIPNIVQQSPSEFWADFVFLIPLDEDLSHKVILRVLNDVRVARSSGRSSMNGVYTLKHDAWFGGLLELMQSGKSQLDLSQQVRLIDAVYRSEAGGFALEPMAQRSYQSEWAWKAYLNEETRVLEDGADSGLAPLRERLKSLNSGQQATLAVLLIDGLISANKNDYEMLKKHEEILKEEAPVIAEVFAMVEDSRVWREKSDNEGLKKSQGHLLTLLENEEIPVVLKVELLARVNRQTAVFFGDPQVFKAIAKVLTEYGATQRNFAGSSLNKTMEGLSGLNFPGVEKVAGLVAEQADVLLLSKEANAMRSNRNVPTVATAIIKLALKSGRGKLAGKLLRNDYSAYRGKLEVITNLARFGDFETIKKFLASKSGVYLTEGLGLYDQDFHELVGRLLAEIPEANRYHLEVVLSSLGDTKKGVTHEVPWAGRMRKLAMEFEERGGNLVGDARVQALALLSRDDESALLLIDELRKVTDRLSIADSLVSNGNNSGVVGSNTFEMFKQVIRLEMAARNFDSVLKMIEQFRSAINVNDTNSWRLRNKTGAVFGVVGQCLIEIAARSSADAVAVIPQTQRFFNVAASVSSNTEAINTLDGAALIVHALAGKGEDWKVFLENRPGKEDYQEAKKNRSRSAQFKQINSDSWQRPEMAEVRAKVLQALLVTPYFHERDLVYVHDYYGLSESKLWSIEEIINGIESLPKDHPEKGIAMFHVAGLKTYKVKGRTVESGIAAYTEALELARENGEEKLVNQILAHRCDVFFRNNKKEEAKRDSGLIKMEQLPDRDREWVEKALPKWQE